MMIYLEWKSFSRHLLLFFLFLFLKHQIVLDFHCWKKLHLLFQSDVDAADDADDDVEKQVD
jgi:hypothetical protein